ncbi:hypothetical protein, partial [Methanosarcina mazei]
FKEKNEEARVHFIPYLKEGVFVTLCAPVVIKEKPNGEIFKTGKFKGASKSLPDRSSTRKINCRIQAEYIVLFSMRTSYSGIIKIF